MIRFLTLLFILIASPAFAQTTNVIFGASIDRNYIAKATYDIGTVTCHPGLSRCVEGTSWGQIISAFRAESYVNNALESAMAADQIPLMLAHTPVSGERYFIGNFDLNDYCWNGTDADKRANTGAIIQAGVYWLGAGTRLTGRGGSITYTGTWSNTPVNAIGKYSTTNGATATFTFTGAYVAVGTQIQDSNGGTFSISVDGGAPQSFTNTGKSGKGVDTSLRFECVFGTTPVPCWGNAGIVLSGFGAGSHTAVLTVTSATSGSNTVYLDFAAYGSNNLPIIILPPTPHAVLGAVNGYTANCTHPSPSPSATDQQAYKAQKIAIANAAIANGLNVKTIDAESALDPANLAQFQTDYEHLSGDGNALYAATIAGGL